MTRISSEYGALTSMIIATNLKIVEKDIKGKYFDVSPSAGKFVYGYSYEAEEKLSGFSGDEAMGKSLWEWSGLALRKPLGGKYVIVWRTFVFETIQQVNEHLLTGFTCKNCES